MKYNAFDAMPLILEVSDISDTLKIGRNKAYELVNSGRIKAIKIGNHYKVLRDSFIDFLRGNSA